MSSNFIVSARKYRPQTFESVVGQSHITTTLKNAIARQQLAHAFLFCGPRGVGKTTCARIFAKTINCLNPGADGEACGQCESCRSFNEGRSFSIHELDAASNNSVENIRDLTDQVRVPPQIGSYSVFIIDEVHMLSQAAFNAFLKTLEEPPHHAIFILATTEKHKIPATILSRCQIYDFQRIRIEDAVGYLKTIAEREGVAYDDESLHLIARKADGGMRDALSMFDKAVSFCGGNLAYKEVAATLNVLDYDTYFSVTEAIVDGDYKRALLIFDEVLKKGFSGQTFASGLATHLRDLLMCKDPQTLPLLEITGSLLDKYKAQSGACDIGFLFGAIAHLGTIDGGFRTATNQRLHVELGLMRLAGMCQKKKIDIAQPTLPQLSAEPATAAATAAQPTQQQPQQQVATPQPIAAPTPKPEVAPSPSVASPTPIAAESEPVVTTPNAAATIHSVPYDSEAEAKGRSAILGNTISDILKGGMVADETQEAVAIHYDPYSQQKILRNWEGFMERLMMEHPRLGYALKQTQVTGHTLSMAVKTDILRDEVLRHQPEITLLLQECCQLDGSIVLNVSIDNSEDNSLPVRAIDKVHYLVEQNGELGTLIQELELDMQ
ncbi:MAG: DNA polymerase III subunit gamma/tau [Tidjanibacter sp.]|nr:DNA polymerase III subunit gamma/tau [Tidjanibacter sp.]